jgi:hypothetical protein
LVVLAITFSFWGIGSWSCNQPPIQNGEQKYSDQAKHDDCTTLYGTFVAGLHNVSVFVHVFNEEIVSISTLVIAIFTLVLGLFTISLSTSTRIAANTAREALTKLERAFVYRKGIEWKAYLNSIRNDRGWMFTTEWNNSGATQAKEFLTHISWGTWLWFEGDMPPDFAFVDVGDPSPGASFIPPKGSISSSGIPVEAAILEAIRFRHIRLFIWGWTTYRDIFENDKKRETQFCMELDRVDGDPYDIPTAQDERARIFFNFRICGRHNCADDDCHKEA